MRQLLVRAFPRLESKIGKSNVSDEGAGAGAGAAHNVPRSGNHWFPVRRALQSRGGVNGGGRNRGGPWTRAAPTETDSERDIVLGSFTRRSMGSHNNVEVLEGVHDVERKSAEVKILASSSMDGPEKREGFGLSIIGRWVPQENEGSVKRGSVPSRHSSRQ